MGIWYIDFSSFPIVRPEEVVQGEDPTPTPYLTRTAEAIATGQAILEQANTANQTVEALVATATAIEADIASSQNALAMLALTETAVAREPILLTTQAPSPTATHTPPPTTTYTPPPTVTQTPFANLSNGFVINNSTLRGEAKNTSSVIDIVDAGEMFKVIERSLDEQWLRINTNSGKLGWIRISNVDLATPLEEIVQSTPIAPDNYPILRVGTDNQNIIERSVIDTLVPAQQHIYTFNIDNAGNIYVVTLLVRPITDKIAFAIYTEKQFELYRNEDINSPVAEEIGLIETTNNKDWVSWTGNLTPGSQYFLRIVNNSQSIIDYCLIPTSVTSWDICP